MDDAGLVVWRSPQSADDQPCKGCCLPLRIWLAKLSPTKSVAKLCPAGPKHAPHSYRQPGADRRCRGRGATTIAFYCGIYG